MIVLIELREIDAPLLVDPLLVHLVESHGEDGCRVYLEELRWPEGVECPRCESNSVWWLETRQKHTCRRCRYQFRVTARTVFHDSHLSLAKWFAAVALMLSSGEGLPASALQEVLGGSYKSAWFLEHRIRAAIAAPAAEPELPVAYVAAASVGPLEPSAPADAPPPPGLALLRSLVSGTYRNVGLKHLSAYWGEACWRDAQRDNPFAFRETVRALLRHPWLPYRDLVGAHT